MRSQMLVLLVLGLTASHAFAQSTTATVTTQAPIYLRPGVETPLRVAAIGTMLRVLKEEEGWVQVEFKDPQWGRRVGWVEAALIRIERPELRPMDLSITETAPSAPTARPDQRGNGPLQPQLPKPGAGSGLKPQIREGFWFSVGLGFGSLGCEDCLGREGGLSGGLSLGTAVGERVLLGAGTTGYAKSVGGELFSVGTLDARARFYPVTTSGFHVNGGVGLGTMSFAGVSEFGLGLMLDVGWDIRLGRNVSLTPFWNGFAMANSNVDANVGQIGIAVTLH